MPVTAMEKLRPLEEDKAPCCTFCYNEEWRIRRQCGIQGRSAKDCLIAKRLDDNPQELAHLDRNDPDFDAKAVIKGHSLANMNEIQVPIDAKVKRLFVPSPSRAGGEGAGGGAAGAQAGASGSGTRDPGGQPAKVVTAVKRADTVPEGSPGAAAAPKSGWEDSWQHWPRAGYGRCGAQVCKQARANLGQGGTAKSAAKPQSHWR